jgi:DNA topoisomerase-1
VTHESCQSPEDAAHEAGLRYVSDDEPGIRRRRAGRGFSYTGPSGETIRDAKVRERIEGLVIPPAWTDVWICPSPRGHIQATGRDARGRKQYRYHPEWRRTRDASKYARTLAFGEALDDIRARIDRDLRAPNPTRERVLAAVIRLLDESLIRVGNEEYARDNRSFGLTTLRPHHVEVDGTRIEIAFRGKSGKRHEIELRDPRLARVIRRCGEIPGQHLFQYLDDAGDAHPVGSSDVNDYLRETTGGPFTAKDFRTWGGTVLAATELAALGNGDELNRDQAIVEAVRTVAGHLGNTPRVCRECYIHPAVFEAFEDGTLAQMMKKAARHTNGDYYAPEERGVIALLRERTPDE